LHGVSSSTTDDDVRDGVHNQRNRDWWQFEW
jgi:hypothetical protein